VDFNQQQLIFPRKKALKSECRKSISEKSEAGDFVVVFMMSTNILINNYSTKSID